MNIQRLGQGKDQIKGRIEFSRLKSDYGAPVNIRFKGQVCLPDFLAQADFFKMKTECNSLFGVFEYYVSLSVYHISKVRHKEKIKDARRTSRLYSDNYLKNN